MRVGLVGSGPAAEAVRAAIADTDVETTVDTIDADTIDADTVPPVDLGIVTGPVGAERFSRVDEAFRSETRWLAVELGGIGGHAHADVAASVAGFSPDTGCYQCLRTRVAANLEGSGTDRAGDSGPAPGAAPEDGRLAGAVAGREAVRLFAGRESVVLGAVIEVPHARRRFLPLPGCVCAADSGPGGPHLGHGHRDRTPGGPHLGDGHRDRDLEETLERAERAVDPRVGIVSEVGEADSWPAPYYLASLCDTAGFSDATAPGHAAGVDADWDRAFVKALGEALERYAAGVYREADYQRARPADVDDAVSPGRFVRSQGFTNSDRERTEEARLWVAGENLATGATVRLPLEFVAFPPPSARHRPAVTTGLGLGNSGVGAVLSGLYEVIERDGAMLAWYSTYEPLGLTVRDDGYDTLARRARSEDLDTTALLLTQDVDVPVVAAAVHREEDWPRFATGMAADLDPGAAARDALAEALQNWMELRGMGVEDARAHPGAIGHFADFPESARTFVSPDTTVPAETVGPSPIDRAPAELDALLDRVVDAGLDAYGSRVTTRDVETLGFEVVRVVVPEAQPLFTGEAYFGERARRVPGEQGFEPRLQREHHPFP